MRLGVVTGLALEAATWRRHGPPASLQTAPGVGAAAAARHLLDLGVEALISFGLAGGLDRDWAPGTLVVATRVHAARRTWRLAGAPTLARRLQAEGGILLTVDAPLLDAGAKRAAAVADAAAVDMESARVVEVAAAARVPCAVVRAIADPAERRLPRFALEAVDEAGNLRPIAVARGLLCRPGDWSAAVRAAADSARARSALRGAATGLARLAGEGLLEGLLDVPVEDVGGRPLL